MYQLYDKKLLQKLRMYIGLRENIIQRIIRLLHTMSEENPYDENAIKDTATKLEHVDTHEAKPDMKPVLYCEKCGHTEPVPAEWAEMDEAPTPPDHCGAPMVIKLVAS